MAKKTKTKKKPVIRKNGRIVSGVNGGGRPKGSKSTGKKLVSRVKSNSDSKSKKLAPANKKRNKLAKNKSIKSSGKKTGIKRNKKGQLQKGTEALSPGRPTGNSKADRLERIIAEVSAEPKRKDWLKHQIRKSYKDTPLAIALLSRLFPSLKAVEVSTPEPDDDAIRAASKIRKEMQRRCQPAPQEIRDLRMENNKLRYEAGLKSKNVLRMEGG